MNVKLFFHYFSYLQYPMLLIGFVFLVKGYWALLKENDVTQLLIDFNTTLIFLGIALSFSTLQDPTKTQNNFSKRIYESPRKAKVFIAFIGVMAAFFLILGISGYLNSTEKFLSDISFGVLAIGIGFIGILKVAIEMFENHRLDKKPN